MYVPYINRVDNLRLEFSWRFGGRGKKEDRVWGNRTSASYNAIGATLQSNHFLLKN